MKEKQRDDKLYTWTSLGFQSGVFVSLVLVTIGIIMLVISKTKIADAVIPLSELPQWLLSPDAKAISSLGIAILLLTPILQVVIAAARFAHYKDGRYLSISLALLCMLALSLFLSAT
ncbi:MAG: DUF1634 domain-containing protein [Chloroflexi bacterium]|nr:DUF1634 domain-containing protein [Chloroflexota bacterium]MBM3154575.1 DUF1634 domain-containing protein [Chloroflexota bacterium]MBM3173274.1 DUF1634 domain-containing protein [Chloroflexota bacterium]MBM3175128.1 DUF1634 domain-containing protein [Chloroflexota bacterium]MBM4449783.1 DUF1634 domain-containing protein [Chloroflexota bacterium]